jgi:hypothetical protein
MTTFGIKYGWLGSYNVVVNPVLSNLKFQVRILQTFNFT